MEGETYDIPIRPEVTEKEMNNRKEAVEGTARPHRIKISVNSIKKLGEK